MTPNREQELEDEVLLLRQQLQELRGSDQELGVLMAVRHGMTLRMASILLVLVKRAPAVVSKVALHQLIYGHQSDGGPEPKIFAVHISRLRSLLKRVKAPGKIDTVWNAGYRASPELVAWVKSRYESAKEK